jgi:hypothetical protein
MHVSRPRQLRVEVEQRRKASMLCNRVRVCVCVCVCVDVCGCVCVVRNRACVWEGAKSWELDSILMSIHLPNKDETWSKFKNIQQSAPSPTSSIIHHHAHHSAWTLPTKQVDERDTIRVRNVVVRFIHMQQRWWENTRAVRWRLRTAARSGRASATRTNIITAIRASPGEKAGR